MKSLIKKFDLLINFNFDKLFLGQLLTHFGDVIIQVALISWLIYTVDMPGSILAILLFAFVFPSLIISPIAGSLVDRFSRKKIMILSALYRMFIVIFGLFAYLKLRDTNTVYYIGLFSIGTAFLTGIGTAFFYPAKMSVVPNLVKPDNLKPANALISGSGTWALTFGALITSAFLEKFGAINLIYTAIAAYLFAVIFLSCVNIKQTFNAKDIQHNIISDFKRTIEFLKNHSKAKDMIILSVIISLISATIYNGMNAFAVNTYHVSVKSLSSLKCMLGCGTLYGLIIMFLFGKKIKTNGALAASFIGLFLCLITASMCTTFMRARIWLAGIGIFGAILTITVDTILQKVSPDFIRGKIFAFSSLLSTAATLTGTIAVSVLVNIISPLMIFKGIALFAALMTLILLILDKNFRYFLLRITLGRLFLTLFCYKAEGVENLPKKGKIILAGNHTGHLDPFIIQMATKRNLWFVTGPGAFNVPIVKHLLKYYNVLPLKFGKGMEAVESAVNKLNGGEAVVIFPEGKFTPDGNLCTFHRGVGIMAKEANCSIVPFAIHGGYETWGKKRTLPKLFNHITIQFGQPLTPTVDTQDKDIAYELQLRVNFLKKALYRRALYDINNRLHNNFLDLLQEKGDLYGQTKALSIKTKDGYESYGYIELSRLAKNFANYLIENVHINHGDRIAILTESRPEFGIGIFASIQTGAITVPLDCKLTVPEWSSILSDCKPRILCCSSHYVEQAREIKNNVKSIEHIFILDKEKPENCEFLTTFEVKGDIEKNIGTPRSLDETALIVYTSGTTGNPKGVMISFGNMYSQVKDFEKIMKIDSRNTLISILPLNHLLELNVGFMGMLYMGAKVCYVKSLSPKEISKTMKECHATNMIVVPLFAKMLKNSVEKEIHKQPKTAQTVFKIMYDLAKFMPLFIRRKMFKSIIDGFGGKMECFIAGGAPLEADVAEFFERIGIPVYQGYGLTETSPTISTNYPKNNKTGTVGKPLPSVNVKIAENGEILASGPNVMQGYYGKPEMTAEVIDENGWFHTGDIGEIDKDGYITITGRIKNMIVLGGGKKIFPEEVEAVLEHSDKIKELCVLALKIKSGNKAGTEEVGAIIVPNDELAKKSDEEIQKELEQEVKTLSEKNLAPYKMPTLVVIHREELPKTSTRKVKRKELITWYESLTVNK